MPRPAELDHAVERRPHIKGFPAMSRISAALSGVDLLALNNLSRANSRVNESSLRLATLQRINRGADDPAGLIAAEHIQAELNAIDAAERSAARAGASIDVADSALASVGNLLHSIRDNVLAASDGSLSDAERQAHQLEVDAALEAIDRIGATTQLNGRPLLDGSSVQFLVGPSPGNLATLNLPNINTSALGDATGKLNDLRSGNSASLHSGNFGRAATLVDASLSQVLHDRARLGSFQKHTLDSTREVLRSTAVHLGSALSHIRDTDVAAETARFVQSRILAESSFSTVRLSSRRGIALRLLRGLGSQE